MTEHNAGEGRVLSWDNLRELIARGVPVAQPIPGAPLLELFIEAGGTRIGLRAPVEHIEAPPPAQYADVRIQLVEVRGHPYVEIATSSRQLYHEFHALMTLTADLIQLEGVAPLTAISESLARWRQLVATSEGLTDEERLGLIGELWVLRRLLVVHGASALDAWVGPHGEPHDLRLQDREIEVKATRSPRRVHVISGFEQLSPSEGRRLFLLSLQLAPAGLQDQPLTLGDLVRVVEQLLERDRARLDVFRWLLRQQVGYRDDRDAHVEDERLVLRTPATLIPVDDSCPALTRDLLTPLGERAHRIDAVRYTVDLEGLGDAEGTAPFLELLP